MANLYDSSATGALNEKDYINKIYDKIGGSQKDTLKDNFDKSNAQLDGGKQNIQDQTDEYQQRAQVEGDRAYQSYKNAIGRRPSGGMSLGGNAQAGLSFGNQNQANKTALDQQQAAADQEFERQRKLLADKYATEIKKAQADNDMNRAQALYEAAKAEEDQLRAMRQKAASLMAGKGDNSIVEAIGKGTPVTPDTTTPTWEGVLKNENSINEIFDKKNESDRLAAEMERNQGLSDLEAKQAAARATTDRNLTNAYVKALKAGKNYQETQTARGQGSGVSDQARMARETGLTEDLTNLRKLQLGQDAATEQKRLDIVNRYGEEIAKAKAANDLKRVQELYAAAEKEEQALVSDQESAGNILAKNGDYSILGKYYGLTQDQIDRLQGTGKYAPSSSSGGSSHRSSSGPAKKKSPGAEKQYNDRFNDRADYLAEKRANSIARAQSKKKK